MEAGSKSLGSSVLFFTGGLPERVILWDVEIDKGGCIKEGDVVVVFVCDGTGHEAC
jgi:hypothetical protein